MIKERTGRPGEWGKRRILNLKRRVSDKEILYREQDILLSM